MKFRVKSVVKATYKTEEIIAQFGGFVTSTNLNSDIENTTTTAISSDSSLETIYYNVSNSMVLRVPNTNLDSTLKSIATLIDYLDFRIIKAEDVALQIYSNKLKQERLAKYRTRMTNAIDSKGKRLNETSTAEENLLNRQEETDEAKIANLSLFDKINFSTINLSIYQRKEIKRTVIVNEKNIDAYQPGFGTKLINSLKTGWAMLEDFVIFITNLWGLILMVILAFFDYRKFGYKLKSK